MDGLSGRQRVLELIGVQSWYSRFRFANAQKTPSHLFIVNNETLDSESPDTQQDVKKLQNELSAENCLKLNSEVNQDLVQRELTSDKIVETTSVVIDVNSKSPYRGSAFSLHAFLYQDILLVLEFEKDANISSEIEFLEAVMCVWRDKSQGLTQQGSILTWPVFQSKVILREQLVEFNHITHSWFASLSVNDFEKVLYFGVNDSFWRQIIEDECSKYAERKEVYTFSSSLSSILGAPIRKGEIWRFLCKVNESS